MLFRIFALAIGAVLLGAFAAPLPPAPRGGSWTVDWGDYHCSLIRQTDGPEILLLRRAPGARTMELRWINQSWDRGSLPRAPELFLEPGHVRIDEFAPRPLDGNQGIGSSGIVYHLLDRLAASASIRLEDRGRVVKEVPLPGAAQAIQALRKCNDDALRLAGIDPAAAASLRELPKGIGSIADWVSHEDYPVSALRVGAEGTVIVRLDVGTDGAVERCTIVAGSGHADLDSTTCRVLRKRARFGPAIGADGKPAASFVVQRLVWRLP